LFRAVEPRQNATPFNDQISARVSNAPVIRIPDPDVSRLATFASRRCRENKHQSRDPDVSRLATFVTPLCGEYPCVLKAPYCSQKSMALRCSSLLTETIVTCVVP
jgi:hypothetical protein